MAWFRLTCSETATVNYYVTAEDKDEARELLMQGEFDDYDTIGSSLEEIVEVKRMA